MAAAVAVTVAARRAALRALLLAALVGAAAAAVVRGESALRNGRGDTHPAANGDAEARVVGVRALDRALATAETDDLDRLLQLHHVEHADNSTSPTSAGTTPSPATTAGQGTPGTQAGTNPPAGSPSGTPSGSSASPNPGSNNAGGNPGATPSGSSNPQSSGSPSSSGSQGGNNGGGANNNNNNNGNGTPAGKTGSSTSSSLSTGAIAGIAAGAAIAILVATALCCIVARRSRCCDPNIPKPPTYDMGVGGIGSSNGIISAVDNGAIPAPTHAPGSPNGGYIRAPGMELPPTGHADRVSAAPETPFGRVNSNGSVASQDTIVAPDFGATASTLRPASASSPYNTVVQSPSAASPWFKAEGGGNTGAP